MKNKGCVIAGIAVAGLLLIVISIFAWGVGKYNTMVELRSGETGYEKAWADVESQYQRRSDLIPNLVATVKGYATHEEKTLTEVIEARAAATQMTVDPSQLSPAAKRYFFLEYLLMLPQMGTTLRYQPPEKRPNPPSLPLL